MVVSKWREINFDLIGKLYWNYIYVIRVAIIVLFINGNQCVIQSKCGSSHDFSKNHISIQFTFVFHFMLNWMISGWFKIYYKRFYWIFNDRVIECNLHADFYSIPQKHLISHTYIWNLDKCEAFMHLTHKQNAIIERMPGVKW